MGGVMGQAYTLKIHALNISASPHPEGVYEKLLQRIFRARQPIQIWGERHALMTELSWERGRQAAFGTLSTFTDIDKDAPWLNQSTGKAADESDTDEIAIPENLKPHFAQFRFYFDVASHTLTFQGSSRMPVRTG